MPQWFKKFIGDNGSKYVTLFLLGLTVLFDLIFYVVNGYWSWAATIGGYIFYFIIVLPLAYFHRNTP